MFNLSEHDFKKMQREIYYDKVFEKSLEGVASAAGTAAEAGGEADAGLGGGGGGDLGGGLGGETGGGEAAGGEGEAAGGEKEGGYRDWETDRKSTRLNSSHSAKSRMPSSA